MPRASEERPRIDCPERAELENFLLGRADDDRQEPLEEHLASCALCSYILGDLTEVDQFVLILQRDGAEALPIPPLSAQVVFAVKAHALADQSSSPDTHKPMDRSTTGYTREALANAVQGLLAPSANPQELGRLGPYGVRRILGRGGMGLVLEAYDPRLGRSVALKVMLPEMADQPGMRERFLREARAAAAVENDHVVAIYQVEEDRGIPYIAMPLLSGVTLEEWLGARCTDAPVPLAEVLRLGREIAEGLAAAHTHGLVHGDVKPANIWLEASTNGRVKLLDFGLAQGIRDAREAQGTPVGILFGTPAYMAPEQAQGEGTDGRADLFSLGVVLYRLCTGILPFRGPDTRSILLALATHDPVSPQTLHLTLSRPLSDLVMGLLEKSPSERPASAAEVVRSLRAMEARASGPVRWGPGRVLALTAAALLAIVLGGIVLFGETKRGTGGSEGNDDALRVARDSDRDRIDSRTSGAADRRVAEWVLSLGSSWVDVALEGGARQHVRTADSLPKVPFRIIHVSFECSDTPTPVDDVALGYLADLEHLEDLAFRGCLITDAGIARLASLPLAKKLRDLVLLNTQVSDEGVAWLKNFPNLTKVQLHNSELFTDDSLRHLRTVPRLAYLHLWGTGVTDAGLAELRGLKLTTLCLHGLPRVTDAGLEHVTDLTELTRLELCGVEVGDAGAALLRRLKSLKILWISNTAMTDACLFDLGRLEGLIELRLYEQPVTAAGLEQLQGLSRLETLDLSGSSVGDAELEPLLGLPQLRELRLEGTAVGDGGLAHLAKMASLRQLRLGKTRLSAAGLKRLQTALPRCKIHSDYGPSERAR